MGNARDLNPDGGFHLYSYMNHPMFSAVEINGLRAKVIKWIDDKDGNHTSLPAFADTSDIYLRTDPIGKVVQARVYVSRTMTIDFDWGHDHRNPGTPRSEQFHKGTVHVHEHSALCNGKFDRDSNAARLMTDEEITRYGPVLRHFNSKVKFKR